MHDLEAFSLKPAAGRLQGPAVRCAFYRWFSESSLGRGPQGKTIFWTNLKTRLEKVYSGISRPPPPSALNVFPRPVEYYLPTFEEGAAIVNGSKTRHLRYVPGRFMCSDFAFVTMGEFALHGLDDGSQVLPIAAGIMLGGFNWISGNHSVGFFVDDSLNIRYVDTALAALEKENGRDWNPLIGVEGQDCLARNIDLILV